MKLPKQLKVLPSPRLNNILRTSSDTGDVFPTQNTTEESVELDKLLSSEKLLEDGHRNQSRLFWVLLIISNPTLTLKTLKTLPLNTFKLIELLKAEEEHTEPMVELVLIFPHKLTSNSSPPRRQSTWKRKEKLDKLLKEKCQLENNDLSNI